MRSVQINYDAETGHYRLGLMLDFNVQEVRITNNYHDISGIVSNWIVNGY